MDPLRFYREVWAVDFEFTAPPGHRPVPLCLVARELRSGRLVRRWLDGTDPGEPPYGIGPDTLLVAYYGSAEWGCHLALGWPTPARVLDLFAEFACRTAGTRPPAGRGLLGALAHYGLPAVEAAEKEGMRELAMRGGPHTPAEQTALLDYCQTDVDGLTRLLPAMLPGLDLPRALLRGRYTVAAARMEWTGVPLDADALARLRAGWDRVKGRLVAAVDERYGIFEPVGGQGGLDVEDHGFLAGVGVPEEWRDGADWWDGWTVGAVRAGMAAVAEAGRTTEEALVDRAIRQAEQTAEAERREVDRLETELARVTAETADAERAARDRAVLPGSDPMEKVMRYEAHLARQLTQTVHLLERLQAARAGDPPVPPAALDVTLDAGVSVLNPAG